MDSDRSFKALAIIYLLALVFLFDVNVVEIGIQCYALEEEQCTSDLSPFLPLPYSDTSQMACKNIWNSFFIRYSQTDDNTVTIILSTIYTTGWVGIGFSKDGMMLNSSCMVGWVSMQGGHARIKQYHIEGFTPSEIIPDQGEIPLTNVPPFVVLNRATLYLAFQLKYPYRLKEQSILLAFGSKHPHPKHHLLTLHDDKTSIKFDFSSG
ncbi:hypothetical protein LIER_41810 [Lithospermum erythrorhizon]|uniref:DOMON domain-containing protein n=1 Tax=Lithospermum erythrorhizon TaxID=34254 RepID=A0AAV3RES4_LITER